MKTSPARATRFAFHLPLRFRASGEIAWHEGRTENISRTGVLFRADRLLQMDTPVEMSLVLTLGPAAAGVRCHGRVVRTVPPDTPDAQPALAATIADYRIVRGLDTPP